MVLFIWRYVVPDAYRYNDIEPYYVCEKVIDDACSVLWCERYQEPGEFDLVLRASPELLTYFQQNELLITRSDTDRAMIPERVVIKTSAESGNTMEITGISAEGIAKRRIIMQRDAIDSMNAANAVSYYMQENIGAYWYYHSDENHLHNGSNPYSKRYVNVLVHGDDDKRITQTISAQPYGQNLGEFISEICKGHEFGFKVTFSDGKLLYSSYKGSDRSLNQSELPAVVFSSDFENLGNTVYTYSRETYFPHVLVADSDGRSSERFLWFRTYAGVGLNMREKFISTSNESAANAALSARETLDFNGEVLPGGQFRYRKDYFLGDTVSVMNGYGITGTAVVSEVVETEDENGYKLIPNFTEWRTE